MTVPRGHVPLLSTDVFQHQSHQADQLASCLGWKGRPRWCFVARVRPVLAEQIELPLLAAPASQCFRSAPRRAA
jgi:hypothetical protein